MAVSGIDRAYLLYRGGAGLFRALPRRLAIAVGGIGGGLFGARDAAGRAVVAANLRRVVGEEPGDTALEHLVHEAYRQYGRYWAATARLRPRDATQIERGVIVEGREHFDLYKSQAVIYALPHLGAWEIGGFWSIRQGLDLTTVVEPARSARLSEFFTAARSAIGLHVVALGPETAGQLLHVLRAGRSVALIADRDLLGDGVEVTFFGAKTRLPGGPAVLALRSGAVIVPTGTYLQADGRTRLVFLPPLDTTRSGRLRQDVQRLTQSLAIAFEGLIAAAPSQWHVFQPNWPALEAPLGDPVP